MRRIISVAAVLSLLVAILIWANICATVGSLSRSATSTPPIPSPKPKSLVVTPTRSCALGPRLVWGSLVGYRTIAVSASEDNGQIRVSILRMQRVAYDLILGVKITNIGTRQHHANPGYFRVVDSGGRIQDYDSRTFGLESPLDAVDLEPGTWIAGQLLFEIASDSAPKTIIYDDWSTPQIEFNIGYIVGCQ